MDANFRLKNQLVSNYSIDPGLGTGMSYMIKCEPYEEYVKSRAGDTEASEALFFIFQISDIYDLGIWIEGLQSQGH